MIPRALIDVCVNGINALFYGGLKRPDDVDYIMGRIDGVYSMTQRYPIKPECSLEKAFAYKSEIDKHLSDLKAERVLNDDKL